MGNSHWQSRNSKYYGKRQVSCAEHQEFSSPRLCICYAFMDRNIFIRDNNCKRRPAVEQALEKCKHVLSLVNCNNIIDRKYCQNNKNCRQWEKQAEICRDSRN